MKLIVGLGNPGILYAASRHNIGFQVIKYLAKTEGIVLKKERNIRALSGKGKIGDSDVVLAMPLTFMNLSAEAVIPLLKKYKVGLSDLLVVCDDLDFDFGRQKIRAHGSSAGHKGINSIIVSLGSSEFSRIRMGIGRPRNKDISKFVLSRFSKIEKTKVTDIIQTAADCCRSWVNKGVEKTMNIFNPVFNIKACHCGRQACCSSRQGGIG